MVVNLEKNLIFISDTRYIDEVIASTKELRTRASNKEDVDYVIRKLKNIKALCQQKTKTQ
jgi:hypothetical protein